MIKVHLHVFVLFSIIYNSEGITITQYFLINELKIIYNGILFNLIKEENPTIYTNMNHFEQNYANWNIPDIEIQIFMILFKWVCEKYQIIEVKNEIIATKSYEEKEKKDMLTKRNTNRLVR